MAVAVSTLVDELAAVVGRDNVLTNEEELLAYELDGAHDMARPDALVFVTSPEHVAEVVRVARRYGLPVTARGAGTGLSGGAVASQRGIVVITTRMRSILEVDLENRTALVQPGLVNVELSNALASSGFFYAPDPSSQKSCTLGGNVAENSGGPHCLAYGMTTNHVLGLEVVLPDAETLWLGGSCADGEFVPDKPGYDLVGCVVGSEGTMVIATKILVRLTPKPEAVRTFLAVFESIESASRAVSTIIARGLLPAAIEMIDRLVVQAVEAAFHVGFPEEAGAVLIVEIDGIREAVEDQSALLRDICRELGAQDLREAEDDAGRARMWQARKEAFGALGRIKPSYYIVDTVVPRSKLVEVMSQITAIAERYSLLLGNVFHAGDGNLHPNILFDAREPGIMERVLACGKEMVEVCVAAGGALSGEHGIGLEKQEFMPLVFNDDDLAAMRKLKAAFNPEHFFNPCKIFPLRHATCAEVPRKPGSPLAEAAW
ncbi:MAG TPA: FAD-linked oxidase C-terminal domain-containing protein [Chloroflexota bacterium]|jgi:glycolate oxidase|nr:FAD-linked oxidase C-terminal domain-containing protein [Chloroflexota bacterium]